MVHVGCWMIHDNTRNEIKYWILIYTTKLQMTRMSEKGVFHTSPISLKCWASCFSDCVWFYLVYTTTVDSVFCALWLTTRSVNILHYSLIHPSFSELATPNSRKLRAKCLPGLLPSQTKNFTTNQASCSRNTRRRWQTLVWKF